MLGTTSPLNHILTISLISLSALGNVLSESRWLTDTKTTPDVRDYMIGACTDEVLNYQAPDGKIVVDTT